MKRIIKATYWFETDVIDVTQKIINIINNGIDIKIMNNVFGNDPYHNKVKVLTIYFDDNTYHKVNENEYLNVKELKTIINIDNHLNNNLINYSDKKVLILYVTHEINDNVIFFCKKGYINNNNYQYLFIIILKYWRLF